MSTQLIPTEVRVAELVTAGRTAGEIAIELGISDTNAERYFAAACRKLGGAWCPELADALGRLGTGREGSPEPHGLEAPK
jgi:DNA-binding CsgD family transcriptional regulator